MSPSFAPPTGIPTAPPTTLPTGIVTFLFTDIEGSTQMWEHQPDLMRPALARHDGLLRVAIGRHGGYVFKTIGDAFCAAFTSAPQALAAAGDAQRALAAELWETDAPLRVRMALSVGAAEERDGDYFGQPLNRAARLLSAGHGGQVLLSRTAQELTRDGLPPFAALLDLGEHRLKDLGHPEHVFQLLAPDLMRDFPPLRSLNNPSLLHNLPQQVSSFIGRAAEVAQVEALLGKSRLLTLTGMGGTGKTRLALQAAANLLTGGGDGVWLVELAPLADPALVPQAVAQALGVREEPGTAVSGTLTVALKEKRLLLVLDNCEHVLEACAALASDLLRACPQVHILTTSREALGVAGEQTFRVPSLSLPGTKALTAAEVAGCEAVHLFAERARQVQPSFTVTDENAPAVAAVCRRLDGIPLALELAAARVRALAVEEINARLGSRFRLLTGGSRTALPRQQTLRALIDWSYDLLHTPEKAALARLSVFAGDWSLEAAEAVCVGDEVEEWEVLDLVTALADKSLLVVEQRGERMRYRLLGEQAGVARALGNLGMVMYAQGDLTGAAAVCEESLAFFREGGNIEGTARTLSSLGEIAYARGEDAEARARLEETLALFHQVGARNGSLVGSLRLLGTVALRQGRAAEARARMAEGLTLAREIGDGRSGADALESWAKLCLAEGQAVQAARLLGAASQARQTLGALNDAASQATLEVDVRAAQATLHGSAFDEAWAEGRGLTWEQAVERALADG